MYTFPRRRFQARLERVRSVQDRRRWAQRDQAKVGGTVWFRGGQRHEAVPVHTLGYAWLDPRAGRLVLTEVPTPAYALHPTTRGPGGAEGSFDRARQFYRKARV